MQSDQLQRREFITVVGGGAPWPLAVPAQQPAMPVVGFLSTRTAADSGIAAFYSGMKEIGFINGQAVYLDERYEQPDKNADLQDA